jgi:WXG100 family type VII secretion target
VRTCGGFTVADHFAVDPEAIADAIDRMTDFQRTAEALLAEIDTTVKNLHVTWSGEAATGHGEAHERWSRGAAMMREALDQLHRAGSGAHSNYTGAIAANQKMWSK